MNKASTQKKSGTDWKRLHGMKDEEIDWFKGQGPGYQTRINAALQSYVEAHSH